MAENSKNDTKSTIESQSKQLFRPIDGGDDDPEITEIESYCVNCEDQGITRLFLTKIPFFKDVVVGSFTCDKCGYQNSELKPAGAIQEKGVKYKVLIKDQNDLNRQIVQMNTATVSIPSLDFEAPPNVGVLTTVEGVIQRAIDGLNQHQVLRRIQEPEVAAKIDEFIIKLQNLAELKEPFEMIMDDPSGNSFVENLMAPKADPNMTISHYKRSKKQDAQLGILESEEEEKKEEMFTGKDEVITFETNCHNCNVPCSTNMKVVNIPHFKEVIIMATVCDSCGHRDNEVKGGAGIEPKGTRIKLKITDPSDLTRDILKGEMCSFEIPELELSTGMGTLGGKFTTVEGLLTDIRNQLSETNPFLGDSSQKERIEKIKLFCSQIDEIIEGKRLGVHLILDDPTGNSYLQNLYAPDDDPEMEVTKYERTFEQNEDLGLNDIKTENYEES